MRRFLELTGDALGVACIFGAVWVVFVIAHGLGWQ